MIEEWRPVAGWEGLYEVSSLGRVRSLDRVVASKNDSTQLKRGRVLKPVRHRGYPAVRLQRVRDRNKTVKVHALVLEAFVGPRPEGLEARHLNGVRVDNRAENLTWGTKSENNLDRVAHGTHPQRAKQACPQGHPYDYVDPKGGRHCKRCRNKRLREYRKRQVDSSTAG